MLAKLFNNISIQSLIRALIFSVLVLITAWLMADINTVALDVLIWDWPMHVVVLKLLLSTSLLGSVVWLNSRINDSGFLKNDYQLIPVLMLVLTPVLFQMEHLAFLFLLPIGAIFHTRIFQLTETSDPSFILFDSGVLVALMSFLAPESAFLLLIVWVATLNFGHLTLRTFLMPLIGVSATCFMLFTVLYWVFDLHVLSDYLASFIGMITTFNGDVFSRAWVFIPLVLIALPALLETTHVYGKANVRKRQIFTFLTTYFLLTTAAGFFVEQKVNVWIWLLIPFAIFTVNLLNYIKKGWRKNIVFLLLMLFLALSFLF